MKTIYDFKKGDEIVRIQPAKPYSEERIDFFGNKSGGVRDRSYMGEKLIFVGIANGQIYCQNTSKWRSNELINLSLDIWDEGWDYYVDPMKLFDGFEPELDRKSIEEQIKKAIEREDYELAEKLKLKLS